MVEPFATDDGALDYRFTLELAEQLANGTYAGDGDDIPAELDDFRLMRGMGWSWTDLQETPPYVRMFCRDLLGMTRGRGTS